MQGVVLQNRDRHADNGVIHYLYAPMTPDNGSVADVITGRPELSTLLAAAKAAGLVEFLTGRRLEYRLSVGPSLSIDLINLHLCRLPSSWPVQSSPRSSPSLRLSDFWRTG